MAEQDKISRLWDGLIEIEAEACDAKLSLLRQVCPQAVGLAGEKDAMRSRLEQGKTETNDSWLINRNMGMEYKEGSFERWVFTLADGIYQTLRRLEARPTVDHADLAGAPRLSWSGR